MNHANSNSFLQKKEESDDDESEGEISDDSGAEGMDP